MVTADEHITILTLHRKGMSIRAIAAAVGHSTTTVQKYIKAAPREDVFKTQRASMFDAHRDEIEGMLNREMGKQSHNIRTAMRDFRATHPDLLFGKTAFYDFVRNRCDLTREPRLARIPLAHEYGEAQIDFCDVMYYRNGRRVNGHLFVMAFPMSNMSFVQLFPAENQQCLFEGMRNIFEYIGFVPQSILFDNASTAVAVTRHKGNKAKPTEDYARFAAFHGFTYKFCNPACGWEKGCVERANETRRKEFFTPPPNIADEREYNMELLKRCTDGARKQMHYRKGETIADLFENDKKAGLPLPKSRYDCRKTEMRHANRYGMISIDTCRYSVSDMHANRDVVVKYDAFTVEIYDPFGKPICSHKRSYKRNSTTIDGSMYRDALAARPGARIMNSDNEHVPDYLTDMKKTIASVRPAARDDAIADFMDRCGLACISVPKTQFAVLLEDLTPYNTDAEYYDQSIQSNSGVVPKAKTGGAVRRGGTR